MTETKKSDDVGYGLPHQFHPNAMVQQVAPYGAECVAFVSVIGSFEFDSSFEFRHSNFAPRIGDMNP
jgi:hypothetical protein